MILKILIVILVAFVLACAFVRFAPSDVQKWHKRLDVSADKDFAKGVIRIVENSADQFSTLVGIALATPRTTQLAGSANDGMATFVTRTRIFGFPDYSTIWTDGDDLVIYARLRFGTNDSGVNELRTLKWISLLSNP